MQTIEEIQNFKGKYPKQLWYLFFSEMWERFCFYGMRGMLVVFMVNHLSMDEEVANLQYGATQAWVYAFTFIGGLFADKILGLKKGADDYLTKPFNLEELLLRVQKLIDKSNRLQQKQTIGNTYSFGNNTINFNAQDAITYNGEKIALSKKEALLLKLLIENKNEVVTREKILQIVWGYNVYPTTRTIDNFILSFRKYFEEDSRNPQYFHSIRGLGYKYTD